MSRNSMELLVLHPVLVEGGSGSNYQFNGGEYSEHQVLSGREVGLSSSDDVFMEFGDGLILLSLSMPISGWDRRRSIQARLRQIEKKLQGGEVMKFPSPPLCLND